MKLLHEPTSCFNQEPPKYQEIANIIKKMKSSSSPCPFDQISVFVPKKCPIVRTYVWKLLDHCWEKSLIPELWKKGLTVLAYKKGLADDTANFRPITLEPVDCEGPDIHHLLEIEFMRFRARTNMLKRIFRKDLDGNLGYY